MCNYNLLENQLSRCLSSNPSMVVGFSIQDKTAKFFEKSAWLLHLIGDEAPLTARDRSEISRT